MASLLASILTKYDGLTAAAFPDSTIPTAYEELAPLVVSGTQLRPPYVVFALSAVADDLTFESDSIEETRITATAFHNDQSKADQIIAAMRFNGQTVSQQAGFDAGTLPALTDGVLLSLLPSRAPVPGRAPGVDKDGQNVYRTVMEWTASIQRT